MLIQMLETRRGSEDGFVVRRYEQGRCYDVADMLARSFIRAGWATECAPPAKPQPYKGVPHICTFRPTRS